MRRYYYALIIFLVLVITRIPILLSNFVEVDEAVYAVFGNNLMNGGVPYLTGIDHKPPLIFFLYYIVFELFGRGNMLAVHLISILYTAVNAYFVFLIGEKISRKTGFLASLLFVIFTSAFYYEIMSANTEGLINLFLTIAFYFFLFNSNNYFGFLTAGLMIGFAFLSKQVAGIMLPVFFISLFVLGNDVKKVLVKFSGITLGFVFIISLSFLYFYFKGALQEYLYWVYVEPWSYTGDGYSHPGLFTRALLRCLAIFIAWFVLWFLTTKHILKEKFRMDAKVVSVVLWLFAMIFIVSLGGRFLWHYFIILVPPLAIISAVELNKNRIFYTGKRVKRFLYIGCIVPTLGFFIVFFLVNKIDDRTKIFNSYSNVAKYIQEKSLHSDKIFVWGYASEIYILADRDPATRHFISDFITGIALGFGNSKYKWRPYYKAVDEIKKDFETSGLPKYIVDTSVVGLHGYDGYPLMENKFFRELINSKYKKEIIIEGFYLYGLKQNNVF